MWLNWTAGEYMSEVEQFLNDHPDVKYVDVLNYDLCGIMRGKRVDLAHLKKLFDVGFQFPSSVVLLDVTGGNTDADGRGYSDGDPDAVLTPIPGTLTTVPWLPDSIGQVLTTYYEEDGTPGPDDPRHVLSNVVKRFADTGLIPVVACELEFYLIDCHRDDNGAPQPPVMPRSGRRMSGTQVYSIAEIEEFADFFRDIADSCEAQGIPAGPASTEYATGQFEVNLNHVNDPLLACDHSVMLQRVIRGVAIKHGFEATFMAKPYLESTGNGLHFHCSLVDKDNVNVFDDGGSEGTEKLRYAVGGMLETMDESMAIFAPNVNSYRRFMPNSYVPMYPAWSHNNRSTAIRIPGGDHKARRFEHRIAGADANPYLTMAAMLAGVHHGITNKISPPEKTEGNATERTDSTTPVRLYRALDRLEQASILPQYLGQTYCRRYRLAKQHEMEFFSNSISPKEYDWYLLSQ